MGGRRTFPLVYKILTDNPGKVVRVGTIAKATKLTEQQVRSAINEARRRYPNHRDTIHVMDRGQAWMFKHLTSADSEIIIITQNGDSAPSPAEAAAQLAQATTSGEFSTPRVNPIDAQVRENTAPVTEGTRATLHGVCTGDLLECVGVGTETESLVIRSADGKLFTARPL
jgi:hypothetical protein